jgi:hypothetical protein
MARLDAVDVTAGAREEMLLRSVGIGTHVAVVPAR